MRSSFFTGSVSTAQSRSRPSWLSVPTSREDVGNYPCQNVAFLFFGRKGTDAMLLTCVFCFAYIFRLYQDCFMSNFVDTVLAIFRLPVAQRIGSASIDTIGDINVGPIIAANAKHSSSRVFDTIFEYFDFLFTLKRETVDSMNPEDQQRAKDNLSFVLPPQKCYRSFAASLCSKTRRPT